MLVLVDVEPLAALAIRLLTQTGRQARTHTHQIHVPQVMATADRGKRALLARSGICWCPGVVPLQYRGGDGRESADTVRWVTCSLRAGEDGGMRHFVTEWALLPRWLTWPSGVCVSINRQPSGSKVLLTAHCIGHSSLVSVAEMTVNYHEECLLHLIAHDDDDVVMNFNSLICLLQLPWSLSL